MPFGPGGLGILLTTDVEHVDLGRIHERSLRARVQRRQLQLAVGSGAAIRITVGRMRPVAVEVSEPNGDYELVIPAVADPWLSAARKTAMLWGISLAISWWAGRRRSRAGHATLDRPHAPSARFSPT